MEALEQARLQAFGEAIAEQKGAHEGQIYPSCCIYRV